MFDGDESVLTRLPWRVADDTHGGGNPALWSGHANGVDHALAIDVEVPVADPVLRFETRYQLEPGWDYAFVQVSTDGGQRHRSLPARTSTTQHEYTWAHHSEIPDQLPGFNGDSGGWIAEQVNLSEYAGLRVPVAFRFMSDWFIKSGGLWIDDVRLGSRLLSDGSSSPDGVPPKTRTYSSGSTRTARRASPLGPTSFRWVTVSRQR